MKYEAVVQKKGSKEWIVTKMKLLFSISLILAGLSISKVGWAKKSILNTSTGQTNIKTPGGFVSAVNHVVTGPLTALGTLQNRFSYSGTQGNPLSPTTSRLSPQVTGARSPGGPSPFFIGGGINPSPLTPSAPGTTAENLKRPQIVINLSGHGEFRGFPKSHGTYKSPSNPNVILIL